MYRVILASASPRRREIMKQVGIRFEVIPSEQDEDIDEKDPEKLVSGLSLMKAKEIEGKTSGKTVILGADTVVAHRGRILGKPQDESDAVNMIKSYAGDTHQVFTGVTVSVREEDGCIRRNTFAVATTVKVAELSEEEILRYVNTKEPMDKAGAYAIQGAFASYIEEIHGDYYNVVGFPIAAVCRECRKLGVDLLSSGYSENTK